MNAKNLHNAVLDVYNSSVGWAHFSFQTAVTWLMKLPRTCSCGVYLRLVGSATGVSAGDGTKRDCFVPVAVSALGGTSAGNFIYSFLFSDLRSPLSIYLFK